MLRAVLPLTLVAYALLAFGYLVLTPPWENPDEPAHFNYVEFVAQTGGLPELRSGDWDSALLERVKNGTLLPGDSLSAIRYENWQPPLAYLLAAPIFKTGPTDPEATLLRLRAFDAVIGAMTLIVAYRTGRYVLAPPVAVLVPPIIVGIPMFTAISAGFSADPLANLIAAALVLVMLQTLKSENSTTSALLLGVLLGLGLLTKLALAIFAPLAVGVILWRSTRRLIDVAVLAITSAILLVPWLVHQVTTYGWTDPLAIARHSSVVSDQPRFGGLSAHYLSDFLTISFHSFWAQFGWMAIVATPKLYWIYAAFTAAALVGLLIRLRGAELERPSYAVLAATLVAALLAYVGYNLTFDQPQGRYLFTAIVPIGVFVTAGWQALLPPRTRPWGLAAVAAALVALNAYALLRILVPGFAPPNG